MNCLLARYQKKEKHCSGPRDPDIVDMMSGIGMRGCTTVQIAILVQAI